MAKKHAVWGIDIGQCALKALRCTVSDDGETIVADKYDFIEYPKILSSADAEPDELVREALEEFLSRNEVLGDGVAISVPGQAGLSRFFKPPPVDAKTLPEIVKYEVKQQIPFPIEDVIWDWQQLGGTIVDGRTVDAEVGLFAMKREGVFRALKPFDEAGIEIDVVQLSPLAIFNVVCQDILEEVPDPETFDPENPPESLVVMSMGTDTTDLIVTNGMKLWLRSIPIGGNHFTKQLSRELKLTQAKAEHLKRNARQSENPKAVFKAMRQVFNDLVNEVQRSLTFFQSMDKTAHISKLVLLGNAAKLPGLRQFLNKQLEIDIAKVTDFKNLGGADVVGQKSFTDNLLSFAPAYGLCLQGLKQGHVNTNLLPQEIVNERIVRAKKPWILASVGAIMLGCMLGLFFKGQAWWQVNPEFELANVSWEQAIKRVATESGKSSTFVEEDNELKAKLDKMTVIGNELVSASEDKTTWIEILSALFQALPKDDQLRQQDGEGGEADPVKHPFGDRQELYIDHFETQYYKDLGEWRSATQSIYENMIDLTDSGDVMANLLQQLKKKTAEKAEDNMDVLKGQPGWVIEIKGHHYHNDEDKVLKFDAGRTFLVRTFVSKLIDGDVFFPGSEDEVVGGGTYKFTDFGIYFPTITFSSSIRKKEILYSPGGVNTVNDRSDDQPDVGGGEGGSSAESEETPRYQETSDGSLIIPVKQYDFTVQMAWIPRSPADRFKVKAERVKKEEAKKAKEAAEGEGTTNKGNASNNTKKAATPPAANKQ